MDKHIREKIALVVFVLLVAFAAVVLIGYFTTGRSWNVAASFVDDAAGRMDGYTVIAYSGIIEEPEDEGGDAQAGVSSGDSAAASRSDDPRAESDLRDAPANKEAGQVDQRDDEGSDEGSADGAAESDDGRLPLYDPMFGEAPTAADSPGLDILSMFADVVPSVYNGVYVSDVRQLYEEKGARVLTLDLKRAASSGDLQVYEMKGKTVGVYSIDVYASQSLLAQYRERFEECGVDVVVCVTPHTSYLSTYEGTDLVIVTSDREDISTRGYLSGSTFVVRSAYVDQVGVVVLTPNNTASARVVGAL